GYQVVWSSGKNLDIIPAAAGKGKAIRFLLDYRTLSPDTIVVAGDSGNDRSMFEEFARGIIVANAQPELKAYYEEHADGNLFLASRECAAGVAEGLKRFGVL
ncbi:MAG: HAD family hydrolase, partial [Candidatus Pacebacteria bacterium]|nr:HAD family hydrolase [Candidatus Paceibacterota bacterium]